MTFAQYSEKSKSLILANLQSIFDEKKDQNKRNLFSSMQFDENLLAFVTRGKLIRGTLFLLTCEMFGKKIDKELLDIASAIELVHSGFLIHDDIIDNDHLRRGFKTIFATYIDRGKELYVKDAYHYGISQGIVAADLAFFMAFELVATKEVALQQLLQVISQELQMVCMAEALDTELGQNNKEPDKKQIYSVYTYKTARYTFSLPFMAGGIAAHASEESIKILEEIGELAGIIFQIKDDEIGLFGSEEIIGKPVGSDIREDKKTLIRTLLFEKASASEKKMLGELFGKNDITNDQIEKVREIARGYNIEQIIGDEIERIMDTIWKLFSTLKVDSVSQNILKQLLEYNVKRSY